MERQEVLRWFRQHPAAARGDPEALVERCERSVRRHAAEDAWLAAKAYVEERAHDWEDKWSFPAAEAFVTKEVCRQLAYELRTHEPTPAIGSEEHLAGGSIKHAVVPEAWVFLAAWIRQLAGEEEHRVWQEIVRYTTARGRELVREGHLSLDSSWDEDHRYTVIAAHVAETLAQEYSQHAHPR